MTRRGRPGGLPGLAFLLVLAVGWGASCRRPAAQPDEPEAIRAWARGIRDYRLVAEVSLREARVVSRIAGRKPDRLRVEMDIRGGDRRGTHLVVFDGIEEWIESTDASGRRVMKLSARELAPPGRPFDTPYHLMGTGLLEGEDFPSTLTTLLSIYDVTAVRSGPQVVLSGPVNAGKLRQWAASRGPARAGRVDVETFARRFGFLEMELEDSRGWVPRRYALGPARGESDFVVLFREVEVDRGVPDSLFVYAPPPGLVPEDVTESLRSGGAEER